MMQVCHTSARFVGRRGRNALEKRRKLGVEGGAFGVGLAVKGAKMGLVLG